MINRIIGYLIAIATAAMTYWIFYIIASFFGATNPHFIASALTAAMVVHEIMHLIALESNGIPSLMFFLVVIGGASPFPKYASKFKKLPWERQAIVALAGVIGNFIVMLGTCFLTYCNYITYSDFLRIVNMNGVLILWNLFPLWIFDGGRFAKLLFDSISEDKDTTYVICLTTGFMCILIISLIIGGKLSFIHFWLFSWGLHWQSSHDDPYGSSRPEAIPESHWKWWAALFLIMISVGAIIVSTTPSWL